MDFVRIKNESKDIIRGHVMMLFLYLIGFYFLIFISMVSFFGIIFVPILSISLYYLILQLKTKQTLGTALSKSALSQTDVKLKIIGVSFIRFLFVFLGTLLLIIPGIIMFYNYRMATFIMAEEKDIDIMDALYKSKQMMKGFRFNFFIFQISFILHWLLGLISGGFYFIYFIPYYQTAIYSYFWELKKRSLNVT